MISHKMGYRTDTYRLTTGREFYANRGIVGLDPETLSVYEGYDGEVRMVQVLPRECPEDNWTYDEKIELADFMINAWERFKLEETQCPRKE